MSVHLSNRIELVIPILLPTSNALTDTSFLYITYFLECFTIIFATPALVIFYRILNRSFLFHRNLVIITKYHYCMLYMALPSRIIIILYVLRIISVPTENLRSEPLFMIACFVNLFCKIMPSYALLSTLMERFMASHYISDYETKSRPWIAATGIVGSWTTSSLGTTALIFGKGRLELKPSS
ncbi:hypothetical protein V3C99_013617 [Haemonchus contortus]